MASTQELLEEKKRRIRAAVALEKPDRVPVVPLGDSFAARMTGVKLSEFATDPVLAYKTMINAFTSLGDLDGFQHASYTVSALSVIWLSKLKIPGRDLLEHDLWQVVEEELMTPEDYDKIIAEGFEKFSVNYYRDMVDDAFTKFGRMVQILPEAIQAWEAQGVPVLSPIIFTIPYEYFCGGRSLRAFMMDLYRMPDKVQAAMDASMPYLLETVRQVCRGIKPMGVWLGGWRSASELLAPKLWQRFVFPYYKQMVQVVLEEGVIPVLHFDSSWTRDLAYLRELPKGKVVLSTDGQTDIYKAKELLGDHMAIMGDVPAALLTIGTPDEVFEYSQRLIRDIGPSGFILAQGCCIPPDAKPENIRAMIAAVH
jgi:uroporphyrinogen-III decarboxylase